MRRRVGCAMALRISAFFSNTSRFGVSAIFNSLYFACKEYIKVHPHCQEYNISILILSKNKLALNINNNISSCCYCLSFERLSFMISMCSLVINITLFSLAQATHAVKTRFRKTRGTFTSIAHASSENLMVSSIRSEAYFTTEISSFLPFGMGDFSGRRNFVYQKLRLSRYP